jgi:hypothetical protein
MKIILIGLMTILASASVLALDAPAPRDAQKIKRFAFVKWSMDFHRPGHAALPRDGLARRLRRCFLIASVVPTIPH